MQIEFRQILEPIVKSNRTVRILTLPYKTIFTFDYVPKRENPQAFDFIGMELLSLMGKTEADCVKCYFIGVEKDINKVNYHILENHQDILLISKKTHFQLFEIVQVIK